jgi:hypothetical protein
MWGSSLGSVDTLAQGELVGSLGQVSAKAHPCSRALAPAQGGVTLRLVRTGELRQISLVLALSTVKPR